MREGYAIIIIDDNGEDIGGEVISIDEFLLDSNSDLANQIKARIESHEANLKEEEEESEGNE